MNFQDEGPAYAAELKGVTERVKAGSDALRLKNHRELGEFFDAEVWRAYRVARSLCRRILLDV